MPDENPDAEAALKKLGEHVRDGFAKTHPISERSLNTVKDAVREQWQKEADGARDKEPAPAPEKPKDRQPDKPDRDDR